MSSYAFPLLAAFALLATSLAFVPAAEAQQRICPTPITVGSLVECATDHAVMLVISTRDTVLCVAGVPPASYPDGLGACVAVLPTLAPALP